jgi:hypothetical protein
MRNIKVKSVTVVDGFSWQEGYPTEVGVYERLCDQPEDEVWYGRWDGKEWMGSMTNIERARITNNHSIFQEGSYKWRKIKGETYV